MWPLSDPATDTLNVWSSTQVPHVLRSELSHLLRFPEHHIHVIAPDVGGGFGLKAHVFGEEAVTAFLSWRLRLPVKWIEDRREHLSASLHAKHQIINAELALRKDGTIAGMRGRFVSDVGAYSDFPWGRDSKRNMLRRQCLVHIRSRRSGSRQCR